MVRDHVNSDTLSRACLRPCSRNTQSRSRSSTAFQSVLTACGGTSSRYETSVSVAEKPFSSPKMLRMLFAERPLLRRGPALWIN